MSWIMLCIIIGTNGFCLFLMNEKVITIQKEHQALCKSDKIKLEDQIHGLTRLIKKEVKEIEVRFTHLKKCVNGSLDEEKSFLAIKIKEIKAELAKKLTN